MRELLIELTAAGEKMRNLQRRYFRSRSKSDLYAAFDAEKAFDVVVAKCKREIAEPDLFSQNP